MPTIDPTTPGGVQPVFPGASGHTIVMSDEFNSSTLDSKWRAFRDYGNSGGISNFDINAGGNSLLRIWPDAGQNFPNATIESSGSNPFYSFFGVYECRVRMCRGRGIFPAFWMIDRFLSNPIKPEIDVFECYGYDGGGWNNGSVNGWRPTNSAWTVWYNGGGNTGQTGTLKLTDGNPCTAVIGAHDLTAAFHVYTCRIAPGGLTFWYDNAQWGCTVGLPWTQAEIDQNPLAVAMDLWFRLAGLPEPDATNTPSGTSNALEFDYVRVWALPGSGGSSSGPTFNATLTTGPSDSATLQNTVQFAIAGDLIENAELVSSASASTALYGTFTIASNQESGVLNLDTTTLANGTYRMRVLAYDVPPGSSGLVTTAMAVRTYTISNTTSSEMPVLTVFDISF